MPKFLEDPFKKVSYSFRIEERLLEDIKRYSNATNRKLPETFNYLLKKSLKGINVNNTYLDGHKEVIINIPFMEFELNKTLGGDNIYTIHRGNTDYTNFSKDGLLYEVEKIPNNLDIWYNDAGYYSANKDLVHEGVCLLIVPLLMMGSKTCITEDSINNCLKYIYFELDKRGVLNITDISYKDCYSKLKKAGNETDLAKFKNIDKQIYKFSIEFMKEFKEDPQASDKIKDYKIKLVNELLKFAKKFNDGNIKSLEDNLESNINEAPPKVPKAFVDGFNNEIKKIYGKPLEDLLNELEEKDKAIKNYETITKDLTDKLNEMDKRIKELENK